MYEKFKKIVNGIEVYYAFCECPEALLNEPIPQEALDSVHGVGEDGNPTVTDVVLRDFTLQSVDLGNGNVIISLGAQSMPAARTRPVTEADLADWDRYLTAYGFDSAKWLTTDEREPLLP